MGIRQSQVGQAFEAHEGQRHHAGGDQPDRGALKRHWHIGDRQALTHGCKHDQHDAKPRGCTESEVCDVEITDATKHSLIGEIAC